MKKQPLISVKNVSKVFNTPTGPLLILQEISLDVFAGEKVAIVGPSGSGKSTLLSLLAGLDTPTSGTITVDNVEVATAPKSELSTYRNKTISIIFQSFELVTPFTVFENVLTPLDIRGVGIEEKRAQAEQAIASAQMTHRSDAYPSTLSGGEKQRTAIARALASDAPVILADEPTGSLDKKTGTAILNLLIQEVEKGQKTLIIITHDESIAEKMDRIIEVSEGKLHERK